MLDIQYRPGPWKALLTSPVIIAAFLTANVTYLTASISRNQQEDAARRSEEKAKSDAADREKSAHYGSD